MRYILLRVLFENGFKSKFGRMKHYLIRTSNSYLYGRVTDLPMAVDPGHRITL